MVYLCRKMSSDSKRIRKRKPKKTSRSTMGNISSAVSGTTTTNFTPEMPNDFFSSPEKSKDSEEDTEKVVRKELKAMLQKMDEDKKPLEPEIVPPPRGPNPYLDGERCLLCRCERPDPLAAKREKEERERKFQEKPNQGLSPLPLWVCPACRKKVEEDEKLNQNDNYPFDVLTETFFDASSNPLDRAGSSGFSSSGPSDSGSSPVSPDSGGATASTCTCKACVERRELEEEKEREGAFIQQCWAELKDQVHALYRDAAGHGEEGAGENLSLPDPERIDELVHRLCVRDPHQLFQRLESQCTDHVTNLKISLCKKLKKGYSTPVLAKQFMSALLQDYQRLCAGCRCLAKHLDVLEKKHLHRFNLTWDLHNKHLFHSIVYMAESIRNALPTLLTQLRVGASSSEDCAAYDDECPGVLHRYLQFDNEMSVVSVVWRDCQQLINRYNEREAAYRAKREMLQEDWELFKAQRRILEETVKKTSSSNNPNLHQLELETMKRLQGIGSSTGLDGNSVCPNCNAERKCRCQECSVNHYITCGLLSCDLAAAHLTPSPLVPAHHPPVFHPTAASMTIGGAPVSLLPLDVSPPSMPSSESSSTGSSSPILVSPERLALPFDGPLMTDDEIPEEIDSSGSSSEDDDEIGRQQSPSCSCYTCLAKSGQVGPLTRESLLAAAAGFSHQQAPGVEARPLVGASGCQCHVCLQREPGKLYHLPPPPPPPPPATSDKGGGSGGPTSPPPINLASPLHFYPHIHGTSPHVGVHTLRPAGVSTASLYDLHGPPPPPSSSATPVSSSGLTTDHGKGGEGGGSKTAVSSAGSALGEWEASYLSSQASLLAASSHHLGLSSSLFPSAIPPLITPPASVEESGLASHYPHHTPFSPHLPKAGRSGQCSAASTSNPHLIPPHTMGGGVAASSSAGVGGGLSSSLSSLKSRLAHLTSLSPAPPPPPANTTCLLNAAAAGLYGSGGDTTSLDHCTPHGYHLLYTQAGPTASVMTGGTYATSSTAMYNTSSLGGASPHLGLHDCHDLSELGARAACSAAGSIASSGPDGAYHVPTSLSLPSLTPNIDVSLPPGSLGVRQAPIPARASAASVTIQNTSSSASQPVSAPSCHPSAGATNLERPKGATGAVGAAPPPPPPQPREEHQAPSQQPPPQPPQASQCQGSGAAGASAQRDAKHCDCCYCEFFGPHSTYTLPQNKQYQETRERLRQKLKKKTETKDHSEEDISRNHKKKGSPPKPKPVGAQDLDALLEFIEGPKPKPPPPAAAAAAAVPDKLEKKASKKTKKKKEKKADEKVKKDTAPGESDKQDRQPEVQQPPPPQLQMNSADDKPKPEPSAPAPVPQHRKIAVAVGSSVPAQPVRKGRGKEQLDVTKATAPPPAGAVHEASRRDKQKPDKKTQNGWIGGAKGAATEATSHNATSYGGKQQHQNGDGWTVASAQHTRSTKPQHQPKTAPAAEAASKPQRSFNSHQQQAVNGHRPAQHQEKQTTARPDPVKTQHPSATKAKPAQQQHRPAAAHHRPPPAPAPATSQEAPLTNGHSRQPQGSPQAGKLGVKRSQQPRGAAASQPQAETQRVAPNKNGVILQSGGLNGVDRKLQALSPGKHRGPARKEREGTKVSSKKPKEDDGASFSDASPHKTSGDDFDRELDDFTRLCQENKPQGPRTKIAWDPDRFASLNKVRKTNVC